MRSWNKPVKVPAVDGFPGGFQNTGKTTALGCVLPVERTKGSDIRIEDNTGDVASRGSGLHTIPGPQHQGCAMSLKAGQALLAGPRT